MSLLKNYLESTPSDLQQSSTVAYLAALDHLREISPAVAGAIIQELNDQRSHLKLIASENYCSLAVQLAMGNLLTDKYAEGHPFHRFYAGCENVDTIEDLAARTLIDLFGCNHAYVQPHSGADANLVAFWAILMARVQNPTLERLAKKSIDELTPQEHETMRQAMLQQKIMGLSLNGGGHLTHGYRHNVSSKMMQAISYDVDPKTELLDYKEIEKLAREHRPAILLAGYSAYPRRLDFAALRTIADSVGAALMVDMAHFCGLVAGKVFRGDENPIPFADIVTSTTHKTLRGPRGGFVLCTNALRPVVDRGCPTVLGGPLPHVLAAKAIAFQEASTPSFATYAQKIVDNARSLAVALTRRGVRLTTGGTDNHLVIVDLERFGLTGRQAESALRAAGLTVNRNAIPNDPNGPWYTRGIRMGSPATTTLGMGETEMEEIADITVDVLSNTKPKASAQGTNKALYETDSEVLSRSNKRCQALLQSYPLYPEIPSLTNSLCPNSR